MSDDIIARLVFRLNTRKNDLDAAIAADEIERLSARLAEVEEKIENAKQAMSETQPSWEYRCHAIVAALGCNYGGPTPDIPEEHTWYARNLKLNKDRAERLEAALKEAADRLQKGADHVVYWSLIETPRRLPNIPTAVEISAGHLRDIEADMRAALSDSPHKGDE